MSHHKPRRDCDRRRAKFYKYEQGKAQREREAARQREPQPSGRGSVQSGFDAELRLLEATIELSLPPWIRSVFPATDEEDRLGGVDYWAIIDVLGEFIKVGIQVKSSFDGAARFAASNWYSFPVVTLVLRSSMPTLDVRARLVRAMQDVRDRLVAFAMKRRSDAAVATVEEMTNE